MSQNATASWSGYSHQGKVGLLIALRKLNSPGMNQEDLNDYWLDYEVQEDVRIGKSTLTLEVHQVKAYVGGIYLASYTDALATFNHCAGGNFIHSIVDIVNWNNLTPALNPHTVVRYPYALNMNHCPLGEIEVYIKQEIQRFLHVNGSLHEGNDSYADGVYFQFLGKLDEKIREEHRTKTKINYNIRFSLQEIENLVLHSPNYQKTRIQGIRDNIYHTYVSLVHDIHDGSINISDTHQEAVESAIEQISKLEDVKLVRFLQNINPHTTCNLIFDKITETSAFYNSDNFYSIFLYVLIRVTGSPYKLDESEIPHYFRDKSYLLSSIQSSSTDIWRHAEKILNNNNIDFSAYETDFIITDNYNGRIGDAAKAIIERDSGKFFHAKDMIFIPKVEAIQQLN
ncbi:hypothetical protein SAMN05216436_1354 [bacterium A37T11]|nr:hypothetical protein SAMN05216436_1354 [bacterium A37T11]